MLNEKEGVHVKKEQPKSKESYYLRTKNFHVTDYNYRRIQISF